MKKMTTAACALALGMTWAAVPTIAQETTKKTIEQKADTAGDKMDRAWDKTKTKARDVKDTVKDKLGVSALPSEDVRSAQQALQDKGFSPGRIDGVMGPRTTAAVKAFQQKESLNVTGSLDADTLARLTASSPAASPATDMRENNPKRQSQ